MLMMFFKAIKIPSLGLITIIFFIGCGFPMSCEHRESNVVRYDNGHQLLSVNDLTKNGEKLDKITVRSIGSDSVLLGEEFLIKVFLDTPTFEIINAFVDCSDTPIPAVDTISYQVIGCTKSLFVKDDTGHIGFKPQKVGEGSFPSITILTRDSERIYRTFNYSFSYKVYDLK